MVSIIRFFFLRSIMTALVLSACTKVRSVASFATSNAFQFPSFPKSPPSASVGRRGQRWRFSAAYGRTAFRHIRGDVDSWRMTSSTEESSYSASSSSSSAAADTLSENLKIYRNQNNLDDQVFSAMSADGGLKVTVATIRNLLNEMMIQHSMNPLPGGE